VLRALEPERTLCFASDYPHWDFDAPDRTLRELPAAWREPIAWRNAAELYRLPVAAGA
jgi:predicted TIM-barrel fold metal-dependent hydrolase